MTCRFSPFLTGSVFLLSVAIFYSVWTTQTGCNAVGLLDHLTLLLLFVLGHELLGKISDARWRSTARLGLMAILAIFFFLNTLHFRFFHTWGNTEAARQWADLISIWSSLKVLSKPVDAIFFFVVPLIGWSLSRKDTASVPKKTLLLLIVGCSVVHTALASPEILYNENDALLYAIRQKAATTWTSFSKKNPATLGLIDGQKYQLINSSLYDNAGSQDFPLMKIPVAHSRPLPFQLDKQPNVVFILMESVRAYESGAYGASPSFTPNLDRLSREGFHFKNFYANSYQTVRAEYSIHSSFVPEAQGSPEFVERPELPLVTWPMMLKQHGYSTLWIGSYTPTYDNKQAFFAHHGITSLFWDIPKGFKKVGWGPSDEDLFDYAYTVLSKQKGPYFAEIMTLSDHFPWDDGSPTAALAPPAKGDAMYKKYAQGMFYTDYAIGKFFDRIRADSRFDNTLFVICGDHGIWLFPDNVPDNATLRQEIYFRVPMLMWSKRLTPRVIDTIGSQIDIGPSVLDLLSLRDKNYLAGTSLFRHDTGERFVLMSQDGRWNMRRGNIYTYDVGPEVFKTHYPFKKDEYNRLIKNRHMEHVDFTTDDDLLLKKIDPQHLKLLSSPDDTDRIHRFAEGAFAFYHSLLITNKIAPQETTGSSSSDHCSKNE